MPMHHCPDEKCHDKVEALQTDMISKNRLLKVLGWGFGIFGFAILAAVAYSWSDGRNIPTIYFTKIAATEMATTMERRLQPIEIYQAKNDLDIEYIKEGIKKLAEKQEEFSKIMLRIDRKFR